MTAAARIAATFRLGLVVALVGIALAASAAPVDESFDTAPAT
jgi:hypothetical protein